MPIEIKSGLHWWTATLPRLEPVILEHIGPLSFGQPQTPGGFGHPYQRVHESGARLYCGSSREDQPLVLNASGEVCETWAPQLLSWTRALSGSCTRADLAVDVEPAELARPRMIQLLRDFRAGRADTRMRKDKWEWQRSGDSDTGGDTVYFGGKYASSRLRCYDVRGPLRLEWQFRPDDRDYGRHLPMLIERQGVLYAWRSLCVSKLSFPGREWFREIVDGEAEEVPAGERLASSLPDVMAFLKKQFGPTLWALLQMGVPIGDLASEPERVKGDQRAKLLAWSRDGDAMGYDGAKLREALKCVRK